MTYVCSFIALGAVQLGAGEAGHPARPAVLLLLLLVVCVACCSGCVAAAIMDAVVQARFLCATSELALAAQQQGLWNAAGWLLLLLLLPLRLDRSTSTCSRYSWGGRST